MASGIYTERIFTTDNMNLAAVLLTFNARLCSHMPLEWVHEYPSVEEYVRARRDPKYKVKHVVTFNFDLNGADAKSIVEAYDKATATADQEFRNIASQCGIEPKILDKLLKAYSKAIVSSCRETLEAREELIERKEQFPATAKWNHVHGVGKGQFARFGLFASAETIKGLLRKIM